MHYKERHVSPLGKMIGEDNKDAMLHLLGLTRVRKSYLVAVCATVFVKPFPLRATPVPL